MSRPTEKQQISTTLNHEIRQLRAAWTVLRTLGAIPELLDHLDDLIRERGGETEANRRERWDKYINRGVYPDKCGKPFGGDAKLKEEARKTRAIHIKNRFGVVS